MQHHARHGRKTGLSSDMAGTAVLDPKLPFATPDTSAYAGPPMCLAKYGAQGVLRSR
jgi:hypothetical protein